MYERNGASIRNIAEVLWETPPAHYDAHSKMLVTPATAGTRRFDHRISSYQPKGYVAPHRHKVQEQIYHVLEGGKRSTAALLPLGRTDVLGRPWYGVFELSLWMTLSTTRR